MNDKFRLAVDSDAEAMAAYVIASSDTRREALLRLAGVTFAEQETITKAQRIVEQRVVWGWNQ